MVFFSQNFTLQVPAALAVPNSKFCLLRLLEPLLSARILCPHAKSLQMSMEEKQGECESHWVLSFSQGFRVSQVLSLCVALQCFIYLFFVSCAGFIVDFNGKKLSPNRAYWKQNFSFSVTILKISELFFKLSSLLIVFNILAWWSDNI